MPLQPVSPTLKAGTLLAQTRTHKYAIFPAPTKGLDAAAPLTAQDPLTASVLDNFWCRKWGPELRKGYARWTTNLGGVGTEAAVYTLMSYLPPPGALGTFLPKMFAGCNDGNVYDVTAETAEGAVPVAAVNIPGQVNAGVMSSVNFGTAATNYLCVVVAGGGYWTFDHTGGWVDRTAALTGHGTAPVSFDFVMTWKNRLWFIRANTTEAYYLPVDSIQGALTKFDFGPVFQSGGSLAAMASWTMDGGDGMNDQLVIVGTGGDVLIYQGTDPSSSATFGLVGRWYIGTPPSGRRFMSSHGGDLAIITESGIEYLSQLQSGRGLLDPESPKDSPAYRYNVVLGSEVAITRGQNFWQILSVAKEQSLLVTTPRLTVSTAKQYVFSNIARAWSTFSRMPMSCACIFEGELYFGTIDGKVMHAVVSDSDDELTDGTPGAAIQGSLQTAYVADPDNPMTLMRPQLIMPMFQSSQAPQLMAQINTEWRNQGTIGSPSFAGVEGSLWGTGVWGTALWSSAESAYFSWLGATGLGVYASLRLAVLGAPGTIFTSWKLVYEPGGIM